ncbi:DUF1279 superfamily [Rhizina undulata]
MATRRLLPQLLRPRITPSIRPRAPLFPRRWNTTTAGNGGVTPPKPSFSARMKSLSKEYGYSALGVYLGLSALDFPFCFLAVRTLGTERIGAWEEAAVSWGKRTFGPAIGHVKRSLGIAENVVAEEVVVEEKEEEKGGASLWTELALAYAVHKSLIFIRVPLTAAVTPKVVRVLRGWGWDIGKKGAPKIGGVGRKKP